MEAVILEKTKAFGRDTSGFVDTPCRVIGRLALDPSNLVFIANIENIPTSDENELVKRFQRDTKKVTIVSCGPTLRIAQCGTQKPETKEAEVEHTYFSFAIC